MLKNIVPFALYTEHQRKIQNICLSSPFSGLSPPALLAPSRTNHVHLGWVLDTAVNWVSRVLEILWCGFPPVTPRVCITARCCRDPATWWATLALLLEVYYSSCHQSHAQPHLSARKWLCCLDWQPKDKKAWQNYINNCLDCTTK